MKIEIREPQTINEWEDYYTIRYEELRAPWGQPKGSEKDMNEDVAHHFALFLQNEMIGVLRLDETNDISTVQFRFMAIKSNFQGNSYGNILMQHAETYAKKMHKKTVVLHAREKAISFYEKLGFSRIEKSHLLFNTIQHYKMLKNI